MVAHGGYAALHDGSRGEVRLRDTDPVNLSTLFRESMRTEEATYDALVKLIGSEEKARARMNDSMEEMETEMRLLLQRRVNFGRRKPRPTSSTSGTRPAEPAEAAAAATTESPRLVEVLCACGCGQKRWCPKGHEVEPVGERRKLSQLAESGAARVNGRAQKAYCEQLSKPRPKQEDAPQPGPARAPDLARLRALSQPRPPPPEPPSPASAAREEAANAAAAAARALPRRHSESAPVLPRPAPKAPASEEALERLVASRSGAVGPDMRGPPRRELKLRATSDEEFQGLKELLRVAERRSSARLAEDRDAARRRGRGAGPSLLAGSGTFDLDDYGGASSSWQNSKVRTFSAQKSYVDSRLYPTAAAKPGSLQELEQRLEQLRRERFQREAQAQAAGGGASPAP